MAENAPPPSATTPATESSRGVPYYEKLRKDLRDALARKRALDATLANLEDQIYRHESAYLDETSSAGNIIRGFESYIKGGASMPGPSSTSTTRRKAGVTDSDRIFSRSSACQSRDSPAPTNTHTPNSALSLAATPVSGSVTPGGGLGVKKRRIEEEEAGNKRGKISYGRA